MNKKKISNILEKFKTGSISVSETEKLIKDNFIEDIGFAHIDLHRSHRKGFPEVIFGEGRSQILLFKLPKNIGNVLFLL